MLVLLAACVKNSGSKGSATKFQEAIINQDNYLANDAKVNDSQNYKTSEKQSESKNLDEKKTKTIRAEKMLCYSRAYEYFPEEMIIDDDRKEEMLEIENTTKDSDASLKQNLGSIGLLPQDFVAKKEESEEAKKKEKQEEVKKRGEEKKNNSAIGLYQRYEVNKLRQRYVNNCQAEVEKSN